MRDLVESGDYFLDNITPKAVGGPFTREEPADAHLPWEKRRKKLSRPSTNINKLETILFKSTDQEKKRDHTKKDNDEEREAD